MAVIMSPAPRCFNEAAVTWPRKYEQDLYRRLGIDGFNEAAVTWPRK